MDENILCGMLHCKHLNERLEFGMESVSILSHSFLNLKGSIVACRTAIVDLGINQVDPGLAPDGARCGDGKICVNQKCMSVESSQFISKTCESNCNGNGWCNNLGHCHCKDGFAPPFCENPGPGGSEDSGPASDPNARKEFVVAMFVIFLGIIPAMVIVAFLTYYFRQNVLNIRPIKSSPPTNKSPSKSRLGFNLSPDSKPTEDNHSLLQNDRPITNLQNEFFGHFKGFSLTPMKKVEVEPSRAAPPVPSPAPVVAKPQVVHRAHSFKQILSGVTSAGPALPPPNPGSTAKPIISSPILENSTCTAKELISPLKNVPVRPAPETPRPLSSPDIPLPDEPKKSTTLHRITSFLKKQPAASNAQGKASKVLDKTALKTIEISSPILQVETVTVKTVPAGEESRAVVMRAQSMRNPAGAVKPNIQTFGSMRVPNGGRRPLSIPSGSRPKSPPPPAPAEKKLQIPSLPGYQKPTAVKNTQNQYDDCLNKAVNLTKLSEELSQDNIYAVIEESPLSSPPSIEEKTAKASSSSESMGLLGEIVSEIQNRNLDSIYSTSTLARKKKAEEEKKRMAESETYVNTSCLYKSPESVYSNMNNIKSSASSTSSGYIHPSAVNVPVKTTEPKPEEKTDGGSKLSTFKTVPSSPPKVSKTASSPTRTNPKQPIGRQITPPTLRTRKPSPSRTRPVSNSPDLVTSCSSKPSGTKPDVLTTTKKPSPAVKPSLNGLPKGPKSKSVSSSTVNATKALPTGVRAAARSNSSVASLQQKFESKTLSSGKGVSKVGKLS